MRCGEKYDFDKAQANRFEASAYEKITTFCVYCGSKNEQAFHKEIESKFSTEEKIFK